MYAQTHSFSLLIPVKTSVSSSPPALLVPLPIAKESQNVPEWTGIFHLSLTTSVAGALRTHHQRAIVIGHLRKALALCRGS
jgi:hypothetical protein